MEHLHGENQTNCLLELISNQLQLASREAWLEKHPNDPYRELLQRQVERNTDDNN
jgi:hypothetical protein